MYIFGAVLVSALMTLIAIGISQSVPVPLEHSVWVCKKHEGVVYYFDAGKEVNVLCGDDVGFTMNKETREIVYESDEEKAIMKKTLQETVVNELVQEGVSQDRMLTQKGAPLAERLAYQAATRRAVQVVKATIRD